MLAGPAPSILQETKVERGEEGDRDADVKEVAPEGGRGEAIVCIRR